MCLHFLLLFSLLGFFDNLFILNSSSVFYTALTHLEPKKKLR